MKARPIETITEDGKEIAYVTLGGKHGIRAELYKEDFDFLVKLGLSPNWACYQGGQGFYVTAAAKDTPSNRVLVARVLMDAAAGQIVRYRDSNPLNLRKDNLVLVAHAGPKSRARDHVRSKNLISINR